MADTALFPSEAVDSTLTVELPDEGATRRLAGNIAASHRATW